MKKHIVFILSVLFCGIAYGQKKVSPAPSFESLIKNSKPVVEKVDNGTVNWTQQYVEAKGQSVIDTARFKNKAQARAMATRGAIVVAQRNLLEIVKGVNIVGETTVEDMITTSDKIQTRVEGVVKGAVQVGDAVIKDGLVEVTMRIPMYSPDGLAPVLIDSVGKVIEKETASTSKADSVASDTTLKGVVGKIDASSSKLGASAADLSNKPFVFNLNGQKIDPSLFPVITDSTGNLVLDLSKFYDPKKGKFPQYLQLGKDAMKAAGFKKGVEVIDVIQNSNGKFVISEKVKKKINWDKIATVAKKVGKFALLFL
ncbi:MAG TPA: hypothetical protein VL947_08875 [Cytophagales bacterium]|nr:hypothetical protein [Cytophagales bacterium]